MAGATTTSRSTSCSGRPWPACATIAETTRVRAYRDALAAVRAGVGPERFILGCGALMAPSVGVFDGNRIGPDVAPFWRFLTTEERAQPRPRPRRPDDLLSAETAIRNTMTRGWMHNRLWANDPDCLLVRTDRTKLSLDETRTLASVIGLSGGMMLSSDDLDKVPPERLDLISMLLPVLPQAATPVDLMERDMPERFEAAFDRDFDPLRIVGLFNFDDEPRDIVLALPDGRWHAFELWSERYLGAAEGEVQFADVEPHACRVVSLRPVSGKPSLAGTTAHIGMGTLDIMAQEFDAETRVLRLGVGPAGRRRRRIFIAREGLRGAAASIAGRAIEVTEAGAACVVDVEVDAAAVLEIRFDRT